MDKTYLYCETAIDRRFFRVEVEEFSKGKEKKKTTSGVWTFRGHLIIQQETQQTHKMAKQITVMRELPPFPS